jgi:hypothetical protein
MKPQQFERYRSYLNGSQFCMALVCIGLPLLVVVSPVDDQMTGTILNEDKTTKREDLHRNFLFSSSRSPAV